MTYNYFYDYRILTVDYEINIELNPRCVPFTEQQNKFYAEHPDASYWEVVNCKMNPQPEPPVPPTLDEIKIDSKNFLSNLSLSILGRYVKEYQLANAQSSLAIITINPESTPIYDENHAKEVINTYDEVGRDLRTIYKTSESAIDECQTIDQVIETRDYYKQLYENYVYVPKIN